jgi:glucosyl-dolichyl phosphate glucuronosyltransferase
MQISVILCTYNRCQSLAKVLRDLACQMLPESVEWEVLVVDNNSADRTADVVGEFCQGYPGRFRYLFEAQQGLSYARNAGIRQARGDILAFVDDDVTVTPMWLQHVTEPFRSGKYAGAGGRILPDWSAPPPRWLPVEARHALAPFAVFDLGSQAGPLSEPPLGTNMAFRKEAFARYGCFRTDLGRCGAGLISNEDTEFGRRLLKAGEALRYEPSAVVYHPVSNDRLQKSFLLKWWFGKGRSDMRAYGPRTGSRYFVRGVPLYLSRNLARWLLCWLFTLDPRRRFQRKLIVWTTCGAILECFESRAATHGATQSRDAGPRSGTGPVPL